MDHKVFKFKFVLSFEHRYTHKKSDNVNIIVRIVPGLSGMRTKSTTMDATQMHNTIFKKCEIILLSNLRKFSFDLILQ